MLFVQIFFILSENVKLLTILDLCRLLLRTGLITFSCYVHMPMPYMMPRELGGGDVTLTCSLPLAPRGRPGGRCVASRRRAPPRGSRARVPAESEQLAHSHRTRATRTQRNATQRNAADLITQTHTRLPLRTCTLAAPNKPNWLHTPSTASDLPSEQFFSRPFYLFVLVSLVLVFKCN
jgi:hypothetical protein